MVALAERVSHANDLGIWLHGRTYERKFSGTTREHTALAILQLTEDIADAIIVLLDARLPGPALSLARPFFEGYVRGYWLLNCASDQQVQQFINGRCPTFGGLLAVIPKDAESGGAWIHANSAKNLTQFHDLTHGGSEHVKRRIGNGTVEPSYPEDELESLVGLENEIRVRIGCELLSRLNDEEGIVELHERAQRLRAEP
jgi:hypothetical protein